MTLDEIRREIEKDYPIFSRKLGYVAHDIGKKLSNDVKKKGYLQFFDYISKYKNHWIYKLQISGKKSVSYGMLLYHNGRGHAGIFVTPDLNITYHTGHFFERYNERRGLGLRTLKEIICMFLVENDVFGFQELEEIDKGIFKVFGIIPSGIVLGLFNKPLKLVKANTFVANETLTHNQKELTEKLKETLEKYKHTSGEFT